MDTDGRQCPRNGALPYIVGNRRKYGRVQLVDKRLHRRLRDPADQPQRIICPNPLLPDCGPLVAPSPPFPPPHAHYQGISDARDRQSLFSWLLGQIAKYDLQLPSSGANLRREIFVRLIVFDTLARMDEVPPFPKVLRDVNVAQTQ